MTATKNKGKSIRREKVRGDSSASRDDGLSFVIEKPKKPLTIQKILMPKLEVLSPYSMVHKTIVHNGTEIFLGEVTDYYDRVRAMALTTELTIAVGDRIVVRGATTEFMQTIASMQENRKPVQSAKKGAMIGISIEERCRRGDKVFKVV